MSQNESSETSKADEQTVLKKSATNIIKVRDDNADKNGAL